MSYKIFVLGSKEYPATWDDCSCFEEKLKEHRIISWSGTLDHYTRNSCGKQESINIFVFNHHDGSALSQEELDYANDYVSQKKSYGDNLIVVPYKLEITSFRQEDEDYGGPELPQTLKRGKQK